MLRRSGLQCLRGLLVSTGFGGGPRAAGTAVPLTDLPSNLTLAARHASMTASSTAASPSEAEVLSEERFGTKVAILNRPKKLNALNPVMIHRLKELYEGWEKDPHVHMVILKANGRAFCAGGDVAGVYHTKKAGNIRDAVDYFREEYILNYMIKTYKKPYISLLHGVTMGGGTGLSIHGHFRIATESTVFAMPETAIGLHPDVGASYYLPRLPGHLGEYLALTGTRLDGADMMAVTLATHFVPSHRLGMLEERLGGLNTEEMDVISNAIDEHCDIVQLKEKSPIHLRKEIDSCFGRSSMEEIVRALEAGSQTENLWYQETLATLKKKSPLSLKVALRSVREGRRQSLSQCLERELRLSFHAIEGLHCDDFSEGCRAVLVDKDNQPKWNPPSLEEVSGELVDYHFSPIEGDSAEELQLPVEERVPHSTSGGHARL